MLPREQDRKRPNTHWTPIALLDGGQADRLASACHPRSGVDLLCTGDGLLHICCHRCQRKVALIRVEVSWYTEDVP